MLRVKERRGMWDFMVHQVTLGQQDLRETLESLDFQVSTNLVRTVIISALGIIFLYV